MHDSKAIVKVFKQLDRDTDWQIGTHLSDEELRLIGLATVQWANLEHSLFVRTILLAEQLGVSVPPDTESTIFEKRLKAFRLLANKHDEEEKNKLISLADKITNLKDSRHKITHGLWDWDREKPEKLSAYSFRPKYDFEYPFDVDKLQKLTDRIGEVIFKLSFPNGIADVEIITTRQRFTKFPWEIDSEEDK